MFSPVISFNVNIIMLSSDFLRLSPFPATSFVSRFHQDELIRHQEVTLPVELQCCWCVVAGCLDCFLPQQHRSCMVSSKRNRPRSLSRSSWRRQRAVVGLYGCFFKDDSEESWRLTPVWPKHVGWHLATCIPVGRSRGKKTFVAG